MSKPTNAQIDAEEDKRLDGQIDDMYEQPRASDLVHTSIMLRTEGEPPTYQELVGADLPVEQLARLWLETIEHQTAAKAVVAAVAAELGPALARHGGPVEVDTNLVFFKTKKTKRITDAEGFWEWMKANSELLEVAFNPNAARKTGMPSSVFDTFYEDQETEDPVVSSIPVHVIEANKQRKERT